MAENIEVSPENATAVLETERPAITQYEILPTDTPAERAAKERKNQMLQKATSEFSQAEVYENEAARLMGQGSAIERPKLEQDAKWEDSEEYRRAKIGTRGYIMGAALLVISLVGSLAMRTGAKGAMAGLAAAIKGWSEGDDAKWKEAMGVYDRHIRHIEKSNAAMMAEYRQLKKDETLDHNSRIREMVLLAKKHDLTGARFMNNSLTDLDKLFLSAENALAKQKEANRRKDQRTSGQKERADWKKTHPRKKDETPEQYDDRSRVATKTGTGAPAMPPPRPGMKDPVIDTIKSQKEKGVSVDTIKKQLKEAKIDPEKYKEYLK